MDYFKFWKIPDGKREMKNNIKIINVLPKSLKNQTFQKNGQKIDPNFSSSPSFTSNPSYSSNASYSNSPNFSSTIRNDPSFNVTSNSIIALSLSLGNLGGGGIPGLPEIPGSPFSTSRKNKRGSQIATIKGRYRGIKNNFLILETLPDKKGKKHVLHINRRHIRIIRLIKKTKK